MRYVEDQYIADSVVSVYEVKTNKLVRDFYFRSDGKTTWAHMIRWVCNNYPMYVDDSVYIKMFSVKNGYKAGVC